jgi:hypothetical protein
MDRDREHLLSVILIDDIVIENFANLLGRRNAVARLHQRGLVLLANDVHAQFDAFVADKYGRAGDELAHLLLALAAETCRCRRADIPFLTQAFADEIGLPARLLRVASRVLPYPAKRP